jgi:DNA helicase II / ATP-dependent DNA helicase PcrA
VLPVTPDDILQSLDPEQREVARAVRGPVCVLAGAGTGKTRAITHRIAYAVLAGVVPADAILAVTFTTRAAGEMRGRLRQLGVPMVQALTFHAAARRQLAYFWPRAVGGDLPRIADFKAPLIAEAAARCRVHADRAVVRDLASEVEWAKVTQTAPDDYVAMAAKSARTPPVDPATVARVYAAYEEVKRRRGAIDFEDILLLAVGVLEDRRDVAEEVRARYRWFVVDEYQDVNPLQQRLLDLWRGERDDLCVVGDPSQTIYSFTGATPEFLLGFRRRHPAATVVRLVRDYRSTPQVVRLANALLPASRRLSELVAQRPAGPEPVFSEYADEVAEAEAVAGRIRRLLDRGVPAGEVAVLFRVNAQSEIYEQALAAANVPYVVKGGERFFERREVREAMVLIRGAARSGAGDGSLIGEVRAVLAGMGWNPEPPAGSGAVRERWESLAAIVGLAEQFASTRPGADLPAFVAELEERAATQHAPAATGVTLASLHAAKGLEWDAVFIVGLTDGMLPITYAQAPEEIEEERRLLYVGITRARVHLGLSWATARVPGSRGRRPSRFLDHLRSGAARGGASRGDGGPSGGGQRRAGPDLCRVCRKPLSAPAARKLGRCETCPASVDEQLLERLRTWRREQAAEQKVPAYCVFTDATLVAIAETRPSSAAELSRVPGVGQVKLDRYAADVLNLCSSLASRQPPGEQP